MTDKRTSVPVTVTLTPKETRVGPWNKKGWKWDGKKWVPRPWSIKRAKGGSVTFKGHF